MTENIEKMTASRGREYRDSLRKKKILVVGMGKSGKAAVRVLHSIGAAVTAQDSSSESKIDSEFVEYMREEGIGMCLGRVPDDVSEYEMLVLSPGVPTDLGFIAEARGAGAEIIGELELAYRISKCRFAAITGTNGKTTTTTLVGEIFKAAGLSTSVVGNIGNPVVTEAYDAEDERWMVAEVSSFQLETTVYFEPVVSAILNLTPDHLNRHKTMEAYGNAKARIAVNQSGSEYLVVNKDDPAVMKLAQQSSAVPVLFSRTGSVEMGAYLAEKDGEQQITVRDADGRDHLICSRGDLRIIGDHNVENALAAAAISYFAGIDPEIIGKAIREFPGVEHRIEFCARINDVEYYNDSKGTNVDAAVIALKALKENIILIAGGDGKSQDFTELANHLEGAVNALVLLGRDAPIIEAAARRAGFEKIYHCKDMAECVSRSAALARPGDRVLLSPACASWDMYDNFEQRGRHFKQCIKELLG